MNKRRGQEDTDGEDQSVQTRQDEDEQSEGGALARSRGAEQQEPSSLLPFSN